MYGLAHLSFAMALAYLLRLPMPVAMFASVLPDLDALFSLGFPLSHRGVMHSFLAALVLAAGCYALLDDRDSMLSFLLGYESHLFLDTFTPYGVMWLYPVEAYVSWKMAYASSLSVNAAVIVFSMLVMYGWRMEPRLSRHMRRNGWLRSWL